MDQLYDVRLVVIAMSAEMHDTAACSYMLDFSQDLYLFSTRSRSQKVDIFDLAD